MQENRSNNEFVAMIKQYDAVIYKVASFYVTPYDTIEDLYQEIVLNIWRAYPNFRGESKLSTWIYRIALNTCITFFRRIKKQPVYTDSEILQNIPDSNDPNDNISELYALINRLGKIERALVLLYLDDKPYKEIAEITGMTVTNVATKLSRIKDKLREMSNNKRE